MSNALEVGDVVLVSLPSHQPKGHEQEGRRPAIVVGIPTGVVRYPIILVAPLTTQIGEWVQKNANLYKDCCCRCLTLDQVLRKR